MWVYVSMTRFARSLYVINDTVEPVYGHPWDHAKWLLYRGDLSNQVAVSTGSIVI